MEDEERQRKLEAGKAKLAEYRQRKAQGDGQKKQKKKKKKKGSEECVRGEEEPDPPTQQEESTDTPTTEVSFTKTLRSGETVKHDQMYTLEPESEVSTTAEDYSSEVNGCPEMWESSQDIRDEELCDPLSPLEPELLPDVEEDVVTSRSQAEEDMVASRSQAEEVLSRELEEIRGVLEAEDVQQLQDFEAALKQRDGIITQLTTNLQQARAEKDEVMREFLELTEQSQKLQLQFQQLQAGESLRSSSISSAAADLHQTRQQLTLYQQQLQEKNAQIKAQHTQLGEGETLLQDLHKQLEEKDSQVKGLQEMMTMLQQKVSQLETVTREAEESSAREKDQQATERDRLSAEEQRELSQLRDDIQASQRRFHDVSDQLAAKALELQDCEAELHASRQKERLSSTEIMQLMGTVEDMQKRQHKGSQSEGEVLQRAELDATRRLEHLRAELDEMYGQQIVQMKQELLARHSEEMAHVLDQHSINIEKTMEDHRLEMEHLRARWSQSTGEVNVLNARLVDIQLRLQETQVLREKAEQDLTQVSAEKLWMQEQVQERGGVG